MHFASKLCIRNALNEAAGFRTDYEILTDLSMKRVIRNTKKKYFQFSRFQKILYNTNEPMPMLLQCICEGQSGKCEQHLQDCQSTYISQLDVWEVEKNDETGIGNVHL